MSNKTNKTLIGTGLLAAVASSLCCIVPLLALLAGTGSAASSVSWVEPMRPYLIGFTIVVLGVAWYFQLKPKPKVDACGCEPQQKIGFMQSKKYLFLVTVFAGLMLTLPYYNHLFYPQTSPSIEVAEENLEKVRIEIQGMTCGGCENHVKVALAEQKGFVEADVSYAKGEAIVKFDKTKTTPKELSSVIKPQTGYIVKTYSIID